MTSDKAEQPFIEKRELALSTITDRLAQWANELSAEAGEFVEKAAPTFEHGAAQTLTVCKRRSSGDDDVKAPLAENLDLSASTPSIRNSTARSRSGA